MKHFNSNIKRKNVFFSQDSHLPPLTARHCIAYEHTYTYVSIYTCICTYCMSVYIYVCGFPHCVRDTIVVDFKLLTKLQKTESIYLSICL